ncbi:glycosyltransferase family 39 protein [Fontivita pretiosa]|uniref:glycosyltransferase family 39 protein n=1 Tax=Fontivita pretiosa TaxID=2989684 RepID=UPI003D16F8C3
MSPFRDVPLLLILLAATVLRFIYIGQSEADFDELWHLELSTGRGSAHETLPMNQLIARTPALTSLHDAPGWHTIPTSLDTVTHPPLYPMLLRAWRSLFGESIAAGRMLSATLSALAVLLLYLAVAQLYPASTARWAAALLAVSSAQIDTAQEVRNYTLLIALCLAAALALLRIERLGLSRLRIAMLGLAVLGALFTHYFAAPAVAAMALYAMLRLAGQRRRATLSVIVGACLMFAGIWAPMLARQAGAFAGATVPGALLDSSPDHLRATLTRLAMLPVQLLFEPRTDAKVAAMLAAVMYLLPALLLRSRPTLLLWAIWFYAVIGFAAILDLTRGTRHLEQLRHTILAGPAMCVLLAGMLRGVRWRVLEHAVPAMIVLACVSGLGLTYTRANKRYSEIGRLLSERAYAHEPVVFYSDPSMRWWAQWALLAASHYSGTFPRPALRLDRPADEDNLRELRQWDHVWVYWGATSLSPEQIVPGARVVWSGGQSDLGGVARLRWEKTPDPLK